MARFKRSLLSQLIAFLTIVSFLSLEVSCLYARQVFNQRYGIIEHEQSSEVNSEEMEIAFVIPEAGGPVYHPVPSYPIQLLKEEREELNSVVTGFKEAGQDISQIVSFFQGSNSLQDIVVSLCRNGFDVVDIAFALGDMGCSKEEVENVLPVKISSWGDKKSILVGITTGDSSFIYYSTATPLPDMSSSGIANTRLPEPLQIDAKYALDMSAQIPDGNPDQINPDKLSCSDELKRLQSEGKIGVNTAILLLESGYTLSEIVYAYVDMALDWAGGKTVELVNCAAFALADVLGIPTQKRGDIDLENLAADIIYNDILMQGEVWIKDGKIQSSMAAIQKTASSYGIDLNAYQVDTDAFFASQTKPVIIHLKQGHWVVLKSVYGDKATIISDGKKVQMSLSGLKEMFSGYVLTQENIENAKQLNITDTQQIRGSGWGKKFKKWRSEMSDKMKSFMNSKIGRVITMIVAGLITAGVAYLTAPLTAGLGTTMSGAIANGIGAFASTLATCSARGMKLSKALKTAGIAAITATVCTGVETKITGKSMATELTKETKKEIVMKTARDSAVSVAVDEGLQATGNDNAYSRVAASAIVGGTTAEIDGGSFTKGMATSFAKEGVQEIGAANNWHDSVSQIAGTISGSLTDRWMEKKPLAEDTFVKESSSMDEIQVTEDISSEQIMMEMEKSNLGFKASESRDVKKISGVDFYNNFSEDNSLQGELGADKIQTAIEKGAMEYFSAAKPAQFAHIIKNDPKYDDEVFFPYMEPGTGSYKDAYNKVKEHFSCEVKDNYSQTEIVLEWGQSIFKRTTGVVKDLFVKSAFEVVSFVNNFSKVTEESMKLGYRISKKLGASTEVNLLKRDINSKNKIEGELDRIFDEGFRSMQIEYFNVNPVTSTEAYNRNMQEVKGTVVTSVLEKIPSLKPLIKGLGIAANLVVRHHASNDSQVEYSIGLRYETGGAEYVADLEYTLGKGISPEGAKRTDVIQGSFEINRVDKLIDPFENTVETTPIWNDYFPK